jgi:hypothetical protein
VGTTAVALLWLKAMETLRDRGMLSANACRKWIHVGTGPLYVFINLSSATRGGRLAPDWSFHLWMESQTHSASSCAGWCSRRTLRRGTGRQWCPASSPSASPSSAW